MTTATMTLEDLNNIDVNDENQVLIDNDTLTVTLSDGREYSASLEDISVLEDALREADEDTFAQLYYDYDWLYFDDFDLYKHIIYKAFYDQYENAVRAAIKRQFCNNDIPENQRHLALCHIED